MIKNNSFKEAGFAAILTLWLIVITATIVVTYYYVILEEYRVIHNYKNSGAAEFYAVGAINKVIGYIMDNRQAASSLTQPIITEVRGRINDGGLDKYYEFIEIYNPTLNNIDLSSNYKLKMEVSGLGTIDSALISWSSISNVSVGKADTTTTILAPGCYAIILSPSFGLDTTYKENYDTIIPSTAIVLALQGDTPANYLGNLGIGGKSTVSIPGLADHVVISEVCIGGANGGGTDDEFVELYNPTSSAVNLTGWLLRRETASGSDNAYVTLSGTIQPYGFYLIAGRYYIGDSDIQRTAGSGYFAQDNQAVLKNSSGVIIDAVGWGTLTGGHYEGTAAPDFTGTATGNSLERKAFDTSTLTSMTSGADLTKGNGYDSNNNNNDFIYRTTNNPQKTGDFEYPSTAGMENNKRTVIELYYSTTKISVVELDTGTGYIMSTAGASLERTNFRAGSTTSYDPAEWVEIKGISSDSHIIPGTPGSLNLSVKFSTSKTSSLPYIFPYSNWWDLEEDIDNDGDTDFKIVARPSLSRFNVNHKLNKFNAYDSGILHSISFFEYPNYSDTDILLNMLSLIAYDDGSGKKGLVEELGSYFKIPDDLLSVKSIGPTAYKSLENALTIYPTEINKFKFFPININVASQETLKGYFAPTTYYTSTSNTTRRDRANVISDQFWTRLNPASGSYDLFDGYNSMGSSLGTNIGALQEFVDFVMSMTTTISTYYRYFIIRTAISGYAGIPVIFGPTSYIGKYMFWEFIAEGYDNWSGGKPQTVKRIRANAVIPVYSNQSEKPKIIYWAEDWPWSYWQISNY